MYRYDLCGERPFVWPCARPELFFEPSRVVPVLSSLFFAAVEFLLNTDRD